MRLLSPCATTAHNTGCNMARLSISAAPLPTFVMLGLLCVACQNVDWWMRPGHADARMYRWVDESGAVHYSDQIPPAQIERGHATLNQEGVRTGTIAPAPTAEEIQQLKEQERLKAEEARRIEQEKVADQQLLTRFRSIEDLTLAREGKVAAVDALGQTTRDGIRLAQRHLRELHQKSADLKRAGKPVPAPLNDDIAKTERLIRTAYTTILDQEFRKASIRKEFDQIMSRYSRIRNLPAPVAATPPDALPGNFISCQGIAECQRDWEKALAYVHAQSDRQDEIVGPGLLIVFQRDEREDRLLTLVWIQKTPQEPVSLYLDLECKNRLTANLACTNQAALNVRDGLRAAVTPRQ